MRPAGWGTTGNRVGFGQWASPGIQGPQSSVTRLKGSGSSWEVRTARWQNLNAKATAGGQLSTR